MAARGTRNLDSGEEQIEDETLIKRMREKARGINRRALITAVLITLVALVFPQGK